MRCDVLAVGTELLLGQIVDTNSAWIGGQLAASGIDSLQQIKVGDNQARIEATLRQQLDVADAVIVCGGLGPTHDDVTREAIAAVMGAELRMDGVVADRITELFASRGRRMSDNNLRQAMVPEGAEVIPQTRGTAPGLICPVGDKVVYAVPGVPHEMQEMLDRAVLPDLRARAGAASVIASRVLITWGESESGLNERLDDVIAELDTRAAADEVVPTLAFLASGWNGLKVRLTVRADDESTARDVLKAWEERIVEHLGPIVFGYDNDTMESVVLDALRRRGLTLAVAESVTGGLVGARLTDIPGSSDVFRGSIVSYATDVKRELLAVPEGPVVSEDAATAMAANVRDVLGADVGLSLTGVAGPDPQDDQPPGTLWVGIADPSGAWARPAKLFGQRTQMRQFSVITSLDLLRRHVLARPSSATVG